MEESVHDMMERMETLVPEYSYSSITDIVKTDGLVREFLLAEMKKIKDYLFHVVQVSYELQKDKLSEAVEGAWDDMETLVDRVENSKTSKLKGDKEYCKECQGRIESDLHNIVRRDRELVMEVRDMKRAVYLLYRALLDKGKERHFIKNLAKIKKYRNEIHSLLDKRERIIAGE